MALRKRRGACDAMTDWTSGKYTPETKTRLALLRRPVGRLVLPLRRELASLGPVGQHGPNLPRSCARRFKHQVPAVRRPTGPLIAAGIARQFHQVVRRDIHGVNIVIPAGAPPAEGQQ